MGGNVLSRYGVDDPDSKDYVKKETHMTGFLVTKWVDLQGEYADRTRGQKNLTILLWRCPFDAGGGFDRIRSGFG